VHSYVAPLTSHDKLHIFWAKKPISPAKPAYFDFFAINFTVWSHILTTSGDAADTWQVADVVIPIRHPPDILGIYYYYYYKSDAQFFMPCKAHVQDPMWMKINSYPCYAWIKNDLHFICSSVYDGKDAGYVK
jgi:hypothetical protein